MEAPTVLFPSSNFIFLVAIFHIQFHFSVFIFQFFYSIFIFYLYHLKSNFYFFVFFCFKVIRQILFLRWRNRRSGEERQAAEGGHFLVCLFLPYSFHSVISHFFLCLNFLSFLCFIN
jgi:hypothetical protein